MRSRTHIETEYAPCGMTPQGIWRPLTVSRYRSQETAERALEEHKRNFEGYTPCRVMKRTVVTTIGDWEDV